MFATMLVRIHEPALSIKETFFLELYNRCCSSDCRSSIFRYRVKQELASLTTDWDMKYDKYLWKEKDATDLKKMMKGGAINNDDDEQVERNVEK